MKKTTRKRASVSGTRTAPKTTRKQHHRVLPQRILQHPQCAQCLPAKCCRYFSLQIDAPHTKRDYDDLLWMITHQQVSIYIEKRKWYLMVHTQCRFLDTNTNMCGIYDKRPMMCREHSVKECEWHGPYDFEEHFKSYEELKKWMKRRGIA
jgi:Fe-S-cluster containining protein